MGTGSFPGVKQPGRGVDHPPPSSAEVKERVKLYLYSPSGPFEVYLVRLNNVFSAVFSNTVCSLALEPSFVYPTVIHAIFVCFSRFGVVSDTGCLLFRAFIES